MMNADPTFWLATGALALVIVALLVAALLRGRQAGAPAASYDLDVYRDQLREVDRDLTRGVLAEADAQRIRTEVSRRILAADADIADEPAATGPRRAVTLVTAGVMAAAVIGGSLWLYGALGAPGYGDLGLQHRIELAERARETRPAQEVAEASLPARAPLSDVPPAYVELVEQLRQTVAQRPDDIRGHELLAQNEAQLGNFAAAYRAQGALLRLKGEEATADDFANYADLKILAAGGYVSPEAEAALSAALARDPAHGPARYYWGLMMSQTGRPDRAFAIWQSLLREGPEDAPWIVPIRAQIEDIAVRAGVDYVPPPVGQGAAPAPGLPGPSAEDVEAAGEMSADERMDMIRGMVDGLNERLATEGGTPAEWARLISALSVLGESGRARAVYDNAREVFADTPAALDPILRAAERAGIGQ
jgi:cytochrome c-type biogenesis protein CcmH